MIARIRVFIGTNISLRLLLFLSILFCFFSKAPIYGQCISGELLFERWTGVAGTAVADLTSDGDYPNSPDVTTSITSFDGPNNIGDDFGARARGYITAPSSGNYIFTVTGDDNVEFYLSTDESEVNKVLIANIPGWTNRTDFTKFGSQTSSSINLTAGNQYYVELIHKEGGGGDHFRAYWQTPTNGNRVIIPGSVLQSYPCNFATSFSFSFTETADTWGIDLDGRKDGGHAFADYDNDGDLDLLVNTDDNSFESRLYRNNGNSTFTDVTAALAPYLLTNVRERTAVWGDVNNDGRLDFMRNTSHSGGNNGQGSIQIFLQDPTTGIFGNGTGGTTPIRIGNTGTNDVDIDWHNTEGTGFFDFDGDGDLDIVFDNHNLGVDILRNNYINHTNGLVVDPPVTDLFSFATPGNATILGLNQSATDGDYGSVTDVNDDGWVDIFMRKRNENDFFLNVGGTFVNGSDLADATNNNKGAVALYDYDNDGDFDAFWTENDDNQIFRNDGGGTWTALGSATGIPTNFLTDIDEVASGDIDNDGDIDILLVGDNRSFLYVNQINDPVLGPNEGPAMTFLLDNSVQFNVGENGEATSMIDIDGDGDLDIYMSIDNDNNQLWINNLYDATTADNLKDYLYIDIFEDRAGIMQAGERRPALGATVVLEDCEGNVLSGLREVNGATGHGTQDPGTVHFGLPLGPERGYIVRVKYPNYDNSTSITRSEVTKFIVPSLEPSDPIRVEFSPTDLVFVCPAEICDNGIDDDFDGRIDCFDGSCLSLDTLGVSFDYRTIANGDWNSTATWFSALRPPDDINNENIRITHTVTNAPADVTLRGNSQFVMVGGELRMVGSGDLTVEDASVSINNSVLEIGGDLILDDNDAAFSMATGTLDANSIISNDGSLYLEGLCLVLAGRFESQTQDTLVSVCANIASNFLNQNGDLYIVDSEIKCNNGDITNNGGNTISGSNNKIYLPAGNLNNNGTWTNVIDQYCVNGGINNVSSVYLPPTEDCGTIQWYFDNCSCDCLPPEEICFTGIDEDGDGLVDCEDPDCASFVDCLSCNARYPAGINPDFDGDGISDICDLDDDNDGILDEYECGRVQSATFSVTNGVPETFNLPSASDGFTIEITAIDNSFNMNVNGVDLVPDELQFDPGGAFQPGESLVRFESDGTAYSQAGNPNVWNLNFNNVNPNFISLVLNIDATGNITFQGKRTSASALEDLIIDPAHPQFNTINWNPVGSNTVIVSQKVDGPTFLYASGFGINCLNDTDGDGFPDSKDIDADGDGCFDTTEELVDDADMDGLAGAGFPIVDSMGLVIAIQPYVIPPMNHWQDSLISIQCFDLCTDTAYLDSDGDGYNDVCDIDDDNDGIPDDIENGVCALPAVPGYDGWWDYENTTDDGSVSGHDVVGTVPSVLYNANAVVGSNSVAFDGSYLLSYSDGSFLNQPISNFSFAMWIYPTSLTGTQFLWEQGGGTNGISLILVDNQIEARVKVGGTIADSDPFTIDETELWYHVVVTFDNGELVVYLNAQANPVADLGMTLSNHGDPGGLGGNNSGNVYGLGGLNGFTGLMDQVMRYPFTLSARQVNSLYNICDTDQDGIPNRLDLDSDNDGLLDVYEAGHNRPPDPTGRIDGVNANIGENGLDDRLEVTADTGIINYNLSDSEVTPDGIFDPYELDSDGDGCYDTQEEAISDNDFDGTAGNGVPTVDSVGLVDFVKPYVLPVNDVWQDPDLISTDCNCKTATLNPHIFYYKRN